MASVAAPATPRAASARFDWLPSGALIATRLLELRRRVGLMITVVLLATGIPVLVLAIRLIAHAVDPSSYGPAGSPGLFTGLSSLMASFGFLAAAVLGTAAGTTDLSDGMFRHLVITGRSRIALYFARIPAALGIIVPLLAAAFCALCLVTAFASAPAASGSSVSVNGVTMPGHLSEPQLVEWVLDHPGPAASAFIPNAANPAAVEELASERPGVLYSRYQLGALATAIPPANEMAKVGLWIECSVVVGLLVGLGLGSLMGQRTVATIIMIALQLVITPILASASIPYFLNGQRLFVGVALDQLRPEVLTASLSGPGHRILGGEAAGLPPMPVWAMVAVIVGWAVVWTFLGAWRMATRDA